MALSERQAMRHRHIDVEQGHYSVAIIHSIIERGGASDLKALLRLLRHDPFSDVADMAVTAAQTSNVYGYPALILECLKEWRGLSKGAETR